MIDFLKDWTINIVTLAIFIVLLEMLAPSGKTKKLISLVSGFILIIAVINPFLGMLKKGVDLRDFQLASTSYIDKKELVENSRILEEKQMKQVTEVYRKKVINQVEAGVRELNGITDVRADVIINEDHKSESFGEVKQVYLTIMLGEEQKKSVKPVVQIKKVEISSKGSGDIKQANEKKGISSEVKEQVENKVKKILDVQKENIVISLQ